VMCLKDKSRAAFLSKYYELLAKSWQAEEDSTAKNALYDRVLDEYLMLSEWCDVNVTNANGILADAEASEKKKKPLTSMLAQKRWCPWLSSLRNPDARATTPMPIRT